jgi:hypothetical protein
VVGTAEPASVGCSAGQDGNGRKATAHSDVGTAAGEGKSSKGVNRVAGSVPDGRVVSGRHESAADTKRGEPLVGCGVQQTRNSSAEETIEVVRNHEGGT